MALDNTVLKIITKKLNEELIGAYFDKPFAIAENQFALPYHSGKNQVNSGRGTLIISLDNTNPFLTYSFDKYTKITVNTPFFNSLKKLTGTRVSEINKVEGERIIIIQSDVSSNVIDSINTNYQIIVELFPQHPNCYLIPLPYNKISSLFHQNNDINSLRYMSRGLPYILPQKRQEVDINSSQEDIEKLLSRQSLKLFNKAVSERNFQEVRDELINSSTLYQIDNTIQTFKLNDSQEIKVEDIFSFFIKNQKEKAQAYKQKDLTLQIQHQLTLAQKKLSHIKKDLENAKEKMIYKEYGQEIFLHQLEIEPHQETASFDGYKFSLDPKLNPVENANRYFKLYHKAKNAIQILTPMIKTTEDEISYLSSSLHNLSKGSPQDILELKQELVEDGYLKGDKSIKKNKSISSYTPHKLKVDDMEIGYGLNASQNENLTFNIARRNNMFLHLSSKPSSHIVILSEDTYESELLAAELALYLADLEAGDILITEIKNVKKNREKRGLVNLLEYKTITLKEIRPSSLEIFKSKLG